jgi:hypothetical protein
MPQPGRADHLTSAPMSRARAALIVHAGIGVTALGTLLGAPAADARTVPPAAAPIAVAATTVPGAAARPPAADPATTVPPAGSRGGASEGSVVKPTHEAWGVRRIVTTTVLAIIALAAIGYVYGKLRSAPPKHPDLTRQREDLEAMG